MSSVTLHRGRVGGALRRLFSREDGAILVETAIVMPILIMGVYLYIAKRQGAFDAL